MGDLVSDGTSFSCNKCASQLKIKVLSSSAEGDSTKIATESNFLFPPPPGAQCLLFPNAPMPCAPPKVIVINPGQSNIKIDGSKALGAGCELLCAKTGKLTVASSGQGSAVHDGAASGKTIDMEALIAASTIIVPLEVQNLEAEQQKETPTQESTNKPPPPGPQKAPEIVQESTPSLQPSPGPQKAPEIVQESPPPPPTQPPENPRWILPPKGGAIINNRWYTEHALERMAPKTPEIKAILEERALERARAKGLEPGTDKFFEWWIDHGPSPRGIPPMVVEAEIANPGCTNIRVIQNARGDVITVIPGGP